MELGSKFVYFSSGDEEEDVAIGNVSSESLEELDDGEVWRHEFELFILIYSFYFINILIILG